MASFFGFNGHFSLVLQEAEERHRQALWADEGTDGGFLDEGGDEDQGGVILGVEDSMIYPAWRMVLRRLVDFHKFQVKKCTFCVYSAGKRGEIMNGKCTMFTAVPQDWHY